MSLLWILLLIINSKFEFFDGFIGFTDFGFIGFGFIGFGFTESIDFID